MQNQEKVKILSLLNKRIKVKVKKKILSSSMADKRAHVLNPKRSHAKPQKITHFFKNEFFLDLEYEKYQDTRRFQPLIS